jgi:hypothetical protein
MEWQACTGNREISKGIFVGEKYLNKVQIWEWYLAQIFPYKYNKTSDVGVQVHPGCFDRKIHRCQRAVRDAEPQTNVESL